MIKIYTEAFTDSNLPKWIKSDMLVRKALNNVGIDLHNMVWHDAPIPSNRSALLKDPDIIPVFRIADENYLYPEKPTYKVVIPGILERTLFGLDDYDYVDTSKISWKKLISLTVDFGYLMKSESEKDPDKMSTRSKNKEADEFTRYSEPPKSGSIFKKYSLDKSGYIIPDPKDLIARLYRLDDKSAKSVAKLLSIHKAKLDELRRDVLDVYSNYDLDNYKLELNKGYYQRQSSLLDNIMSNLKVCISKYRELLEITADESEGDISDHVYSKINKISNSLGQEIKYTNQLLSKYNNYNKND